MDPLTIFTLIEKGIAVAEVLIKAGQNAGPAFQALRDLITGAKTGTVTEEEIFKTEALLDKLIADFNADLPPV